MKREKGLVQVIGIRTGANSNMLYEYSPNSRYREIKNIYKTLGKIQTDQSKVR